MLLQKIFCSSTFLCLDSGKEPFFIGNVGFETGECFCRQRNRYECRLAIRWLRPFGRRNKEQSGFSAVFFRRWRSGGICGCSSGAGRYGGSCRFRFRSFRFRHQRDIEQSSAGNTTVFTGISFVDQKMAAADRTGDPPCNFS